MIKRIYDTLKEAGKEVYFAGQKQGECTKEYVVITDSVQVQFSTYTTDIKYYDVYVVVPEDMYTKANQFLEEVIKDLQKLYPALKRAHNISPVIWDEMAQGWTTSEQFTTYRKWERRI